MKRRIMAVGAHADDIEGEVGGTLLKYRAAGYEVVYVMATNNMSGHVNELLSDGSFRSTPEGPVAMMARRKRECADAAHALGTTPIHLDHPQRHYYDAERKAVVELRYGCPLPEGVPENVPSIVTAGEDRCSIARLAELIMEHDPECIFTHCQVALNVEHFGTSLLTTQSFWQATEKGYGGALLHWREDHERFGRFGEFNRGWETFVDYTPWLDEKMTLLGLHRCQMPHAHLPGFGHRHLAKQWGQACGCGAAEGFTWVRRPVHRHAGDAGGPPLTLELVQNSR